MKLGLLTRYPRLGASSRLRFLQFCPELERRGFVVRHKSLLAENYIAALQTGQSQRYAAVLAILRRGIALRTTSQLDALWIEKDALPWLPSWFELSLIPRNIPLVLDYDDAVFHQYDMHHNRLVRMLLGKKHEALMRRADLVIAGNQYIADYALQAGARRVELLPTVVDLERYPQARTLADSDGHSPLTVGWVGQRSTSRYLRPLAPMLERLHAEGLLRFRAIGIDASALGFPMESEAWNESTEVASIRRLDIGIMPLDDGPFERGKCGYKILQYMACGLPVVASPVGVNASIVEHGVNGFLATTIDEWEQALRTLAAKPALRQLMGQAGRAKVEREFCLEIAAPRLARWLHEATSSRRV